MQSLSRCLQRAPWASPVLDRRRKCEERGGAQEATGATPPSPVLAGPPKSTSHFLIYRSVSGMPPEGPGHRNPLGLPITCPAQTSVGRETRRAFDLCMQMGLSRQQRAVGRSKPRWAQSPLPVHQALVTNLVQKPQNLLPALLSARGPLFLGHSEFASGTHFCKNRMS